MNHRALQAELPLIMEQATAALRQGVTTAASLPPKASWEAIEVEFRITDAAGGEDLLLQVILRPADQPAAVDEIR